MAEFICPVVLANDMQLSEDGNYMWNGTEWLPVDSQPSQPQIAEQPPNTTGEVAE